MSVKLWSPSGDCHIGLTSGHTFVVPGDTAGVEVPQMFRRLAMARGCVPVDGEPEETQASAFKSVAKIRGAAKRDAADAEPLDGPTPQPVSPNGPVVDPAALARRESDYKAAAADHIGPSVGDRTADAIMCRLRLAGDAGLTRTEISGAFKRNLSAARVGASLDALRGKGQATCETIPTKGRPIQLWRAAK